MNLSCWQCTGIERSKTYHSSHRCTSQNSYIHFSTKIIVSLRFASSLTLFIYARHTPVKTHKTEVISEEIFIESNFSSTFRNHQTLSVGIYCINFLHKFFFACLLVLVWIAQETLFSTRNNMENGLTGLTCIVDVLLLWSLGIWVLWKNELLLH